MEERTVRFRPRTILIVLGIILAAVVLIEIVQVARGVLIWILVAVFLAARAQPGRRLAAGARRRRRGLAVAIAFVGAILAIVALGACSSRRSSTR